MKRFEILWVLMLAAALMGCKEDESDERPADHTLNKGGAYHAPNLYEPKSYCTACHGSSLYGGDEAPSCYSCHGQKW